MHTTAGAAACQQCYHPHRPVTIIRRGSSYSTGNKRYQDGEKARATAGTGRGVDGVDRPDEKDRI